MRTPAEIKDIVIYLKDRLHANRLEQQRIDQEYFDDTFSVPMIQEPKSVHRTGLGAKLVNGPANHIITTNPQVFIQPKKQSKTDRVALVNDYQNHQLRKVLKQNPGMFRESVKNLLRRGEYWIHPVVNFDWEKTHKGVPVFYLVPDPMTVFGSDDEVDGIPSEVVVYYKRVPFIVKQRYEDWSDPKKGDDTNSKDRATEWVEYWTKDYRYFSADGESVLKGGVQENIMGVMPWVHRYSGFGKDSPDGKIEDLAVGRLRHVRALIEQATYINSDILSIISKFAHEGLDIKSVDPEVKVPALEAVQTKYNMGSGFSNIVPFGVEVKRAERIMPGQELFQFYDRLWERVNEESPPVMAGLPSGTSGRQENILGANQIRRFDSVVEAVEEGWATALDMGLQEMNNVGYLPVSLWGEEPESNEKRITAEDIDDCAPCTVALKTKDPIEDDAKAMTGRTLWKEGLFDHKTVLVEYFGKKPDEADAIIVRVQAEKILKEVPAVAQFLGEAALKDLGMEDALAALDEEVSQAKKAGVPQGEPRSGNIQTPTGMEMADVSLSQRGIRESPAPYTQGE